MHVKALCFAAAAFLSISASAQDAGRALDLAAEQAGAKLCIELAAASVPDMRIAFLPLFRDGENGQPRIEPVIRAELGRRKMRFSLYTRDEAVWDKLIGEIDFGARRADIMDAATIQKFGAIPGVEALLYGEVREASATPDGTGTTRLSVYLSDVETGKLLWSCNLMGQHLPPPRVEPPVADRLTDQLLANLPWILAGIAGLGALAMFLRAVTRPR